MLIVFAVLAALCGGACAVAEARDRPIRRAERLARELQAQAATAA
jgi:hypothetical protein